MQSSFYFGEQVCSHFTSPIACLRFCENSVMCQEHSPADFIFTKICIFLVSGFLIVFTFVNIKYVNNTHYIFWFIHQWFRWIMTDVMDWDRCYGQGHECAETCKLKGSLCNLRSAGFSRSLFKFNQTFPWKSFKNLALNSNIDTSTTQYVCLRFHYIYKGLR